MKRFQLLLLPVVFVLAVAFTVTIFAQEQPAVPQKPAVTANMTAPSKATAEKTVSGKVGAKKASSSKLPAMEKYRQAQEALKKAIIKARELQKQFMVVSATEEEKEQIGEKLQEISDFVSKLHPKLLDLAEAAWLENPSKEDGEFLNFVVQVLEVRLNTEEYERADAIMQGLMKLNIPEILPDLYDAAGEIAFMLNQFDQANRYFELAEQNKVLSERCTAFKNDLQYYRAAWGKETVLRERDKAKKDLPQVKLETSKGTIVLELYENEAPNTVANFVYLVEKGFYDGMYFESVIPGFGAASGRSMESEDGGPGYSIRDEFDEMNPRNHFRGTISMMKSEPNTAGSIFLISFSPMRQLDGKCVVFGRVVEGMEVLSKLTRIDQANPDPMAEPDQITTASVVKKRDHKYRPKILKAASSDEQSEEADAKTSKKSKKSTKGKGKTAY